jgi:hypothetical protein
MGLSLLPDGRRGQRRLDFETMLVKAHVRNGQLVLDDPSTELPDGSEVELMHVDDEFDAEERVRLLQAIEEGAADIERGDYVDGMEFANQLLARREAASR